MSTEFENYLKSEGMSITSVSESLCSLTPSYHIDSGLKLYQSIQDLQHSLTAFTTEGYFSMAFPTLFPTGAADFLEIISPTYSSMMTVALLGTLGSGFLLLTQR